MQGATEVLASAEESWRLVFDAYPISYESSDTFEICEDGEPRFLFWRGYLREVHEEAPVLLDARDCRFPSLSDDDANALTTTRLACLVGVGSDALDRLLQSDGRRDWRLEAGSWIKTAEECGFWSQIEQKLPGVARASMRPQTPEEEETRKREGKDPGVFLLRAYLAEAVTVQYFRGSGWTFVEHEPANLTNKKQSNGCSLDVDLVLRTPDATEVRFQVKASGRPGIVEGGRIAYGEVPEEILAGTLGAIHQLPIAGDAPSVVMLAHQWRVSPVLELGSALYGASVRHFVEGKPDSPIFIPYENRGWFLTPKCRHVGAVVVLEQLYGGQPSHYAATVFLNPMADAAAACKADWFPHARVCTVHNGEIIWIRRALTYITIPHGTEIGAAMSQAQQDF